MFLFLCAQMQLAILFSLQLYYRMRDIFEVAEIRFKLVTEVQISVCVRVCACACDVFTQLQRQLSKSAAQHREESLPPRGFTALIYLQEHYQVGSCTNKHKRTHTRARAHTDTHTHTGLVPGSAY